MCEASVTPTKLFEPAGFATTALFGGGPRDFDDAPDRGHVLPPPQLALTSDHGDVTSLGLATVQGLRGADVYTINDAAGEMFSMVRTGERVVVPDPDLYAQDPGLGSFSRRHADEQAAIGNVKRTDVMTIELHGLETIPGPNGLLALNRVAMPASRSALWSFAEVLKLACADELSVGPNELLTGLQPDRREGELTARVFVADSLENGAGLSTFLAQGDNPERVLAIILSDMRPSLTAHEHASECDTACHDCIRFWENRQLHPLLNWRLALDVAEAVAGSAPGHEKWISLADKHEQAFVAGFRTALPQLEMTRLGELPLPSLVDRATGRVAMLGHPLWRNDAKFWNDAQAEAANNALRQNSAQEVKAFDYHTLVVRPYEVFAWLKSPQ